MATTVTRKETPVSMRFRDDDLTIIDRGADLLGLSRTEFMRRVSPEAYDTFMQAISAPAAALPPKATERLRRTAPWDR
jgi:uncharacterized protein (DUF1778 family)